MRYAQETQVSVERSKAEIEGLLARYGADQFASGWRGAQAVIGFHAADRHIRFMLPLPDRNENQFRFRMYKGKPLTHSPLPEQISHERWEQACRQAWRALALVVKAKLEAVAAGITTFEEEFMAHIVMPGGQTLYEIEKERIKVAYDTKKVPPMLEFK